jgi:hypothetical protein
MDDNENPQSRPFRAWIAAALLVIIFAGIFLLERRFDQLSGAHEIERPYALWFIPLLVTVMTFAGVLARSIYEVVTARSPPKTYRDILLAALAPSKTLLALVISPVLIALFYKTIRSSEDVFFILVTSFQNGFFWKTLLRR